MAYTFTTVDDPGDPTYNQLLGINDAGMAAGYFGSGMPSSAHPNQAYEVGPPYGAAGFINLAGMVSTVPGTQSQATDINDQGTVVGFETDSSGNTTGFYITAGHVTQVTKTGVTNIRLLGVNDAALAVGYYVNAGGNDQAFTLDLSKPGNSPQALTIPGATSTRATGINIANLICGIAVINGVTLGFLDDNGAITLLHGPAGATSVTARALNNQGQVAGEYTDAAGVQHGFVYSITSGAYVTIDDPNAVPGSTTVAGINDQGQVTGSYTDASGNVHGMLATPTGIAQVTNPTAGTTLAAGPGSAGLQAGGSAAVNLLDPGYGGVVLIANAGADTLTAMAGADTLVGGSGNDLIVTGTSADLVFLGAGSSTVNAAGASTIVASAGNSTINAGSGTVVFGYSPGSSVIVKTPNAPAGPDTVVAGAASVTAYGGGTGSLLFGGGGPDSLVGGAGFTVIVGGTAQDLLADGAGGAAIFAGSGANTILGTAGNTTIVGSASGSSSIFASAGGEQVFLQGSSNNLVDVTASSGNLSLLAAGSAGADTFVLGSATTLVFEGNGSNIAVVSSGTSTLVGGQGADTYVVGSHAAGADTIIGFKPGIDVVDLNGVSSSQLQSALQSAHVSHGSASVVVSGATIEFYGLSHVTSAAFHLG